MSFLETDPLINPTQKEKHPNQIMEIKPVKANLDFMFESMNLVKPPRNNLDIDEMTWTSVNEKNRVWVLSSFSINSTTATTVPITVASIRQRLDIATQYNSFFDFDAIKFSLKFTNNPQYAGLFMVAWEPTAGPNWLLDTQGVNPSIHDYWQLNKKLFSPKDSDDIDFTVPINYPFNFFRFPSTVTASADVTAQQQYLDTYHFGQFRFIVVSPLVSKSLNTYLQWTLNYEFVKLKTAGVMYAG